MIAEFRSRLNRMHASPLYFFSVVDFYSFSSLTWHKWAKKTEERPPPGQVADEEIPGELEALEEVGRIKYFHRSEH